MRSVLPFPVLALLGLLVAPGAGWSLPAAPEEPEASAGQLAPVDLTLEDALAGALANNLNVRISRMNRQSLGFALTAARRVYTPQLVVNTNIQESLSPSETQLDGAEQNESDTLIYNLQFQQQLPFGANYSVAFNNNRFASNSVFRNFNPLYRSLLSANVTQPLLQNRTTDAARRQIFVSQNGERRAGHDFETAVLDILRDVQNAYWDLVFARRNHEVAVQSLELARDLLRNNQVQVEVGTMAPIDVLQAEAEVATREEALILAEDAIRQTEDALKVLIRDPDSVGFWDGEIIPVDAPDVADYELEADDAIRTALQRRPEVRSQRVQLDANQYEVRYFRNQTMPQVDLVGSAQLTGVGGTELVREGFFGQAVETIPGGYADALSQLGGLDYRDWQVGVQFSYPIGGNVAHAQHAQAQVDLDRQRQTIRQQELQIAQEVRTAVRQVETNRRRIDASRVARELEEQRLDAEQKKFEVGMTTSYFIVQSQRDLAQARANELQAIIDYAKAIVAVERAQGTLAERSRVTIR